MGLGASAKLIWGIPVVAYDDESGEPTPFWDEDADDWRELRRTTWPSPLYIENFGHYEDPDGLRGILTSKLVKSYRGDCWDPTEVPHRLVVTDEIIIASDFAALGAGLDVNFYNARWNLVASFG